MRLLIVEEDEALGAFLRRGLADLAEWVELAHDGESAIPLLLEAEPDLLVMGEALGAETAAGPAGNETLSLLEQARQVAPLCPVLMLSARPEPDARIAWLEGGADDVMSKPFSLRELRARLKALLRRQAGVRALMEQALRSSEGSSGLKAEALEMQRMRRKVEIAGTPVHLTNREFALLEQLLLASGAPVSRATLRSAVWQDKPAEGNALEVHVAALRRKLTGTPGAPEIETIRGLGYRLASHSLPAAMGQTSPAWMGVAGDAR